MRLAIKIMISNFVTLILSFRISIDRFLYQLVNPRTHCLHFFFQDITGVFRAYSNSKDGAPLQIYLTA